MTVRNAFDVQDIVISVCFVFTGFKAWLDRLRYWWPHNLNSLGSDKIHHLQAAKPEKAQLRRKTQPNRSKYGSSQRSRTSGLLIVSSPTVLTQTALNPLTSRFDRPAADRLAACRFLLQPWGHRKAVVGCMKMR